MPAAVHEIWAAVVEEGLTRRIPSSLERFRNPGFVTALDALVRAFPDITLGIDWTVADDRRVTAWFTMVGTQHGVWRGITPTGRSIRARGCLSLLIEGDVIRDFRLIVGDLAH